MLDHLQTLTVTDNVSAKSVTKTMTYDGSGNLQEVDTTGSDTPEQSMIYTPLDPYGRPTQAKDPLGHVTKYSYADNWYDATCAPAAQSSAYLTSVTNAGNQTTSYAYDSCTGELGSVTDPNGQTTSFLFDTMGRTTQVSYPDGGWSQNSFVDVAPLTITTTKSQSPNPNVVTKVILDGLARQSETQLTSDPEGADYTDTTYDGLGRVASVSNPYRPSSPATTDGVTQYGYNALGQKTLQIQPDGNQLQWCYNGIADPLHPQTNCHPNTSSFSSGTWVDNSDEAQNNWQHVSDAAGRLAAVVEPGGLKTTYGYDGFGNLTCADQWGTGAVGAPCSSSMWRKFSYDSLSRLLTARNPETGTICYGIWAGAIGSSACQQGYDADGNLQHKQNANGVGMDFYYDALNRLTGKYANDGSVQDSYYYDQTYISPYAIGRLTVADHYGVASNGIAYDQMGRVIGGSYSEAGSNGFQGGVSVAYDAAGNPLNITYPDGRSVAEVYSGAGRLQSVTDTTPGGPGTVYFNQMFGTRTAPAPHQYTPAGALAAAVLGNGVTETYSFNNRLQPCWATASTPLLPAAATGGNLLDRQSFYNSLPSTNCGNQGNNNGNIWSIADNRNADWTQSFGYDSLNRLTTAQRSDAGYSHTYNYDAFGSIIVQDNLHTNPAYGRDPAFTNRLFRYVNNVNVYLYDNAGNLYSTGTSDIGGHTYTYDFLNQVTAVDGGSTATYQYNAKDERAFKATTTGWTDYHLP